MELEELGETVPNISNPYRTFLKSKVRIHDRQFFKSFTKKCLVISLTVTIIVVLLSATLPTISYVEYLKLEPEPATGEGCQEGTIRLTFNKQRKMKICKENVWITHCEQLW